VHKLFLKKESRKVVSQSGLEKDFGELVVKMIISGALPYYFSEKNVYFRQLIQKYTSMSPLSYLDVKKIESSLYNEKINNIKELLSHLITVSMTTDGWTCVTIKKSFLALTIHYLNSKWLHESLDLGVYHIEGSHTALNIAQKLDQIFLLFNLDKKKISSITADNASNMKKLSKILNKDYYGCFAHLLNLIVNKAFDMCFLRKKKCKTTITVDEEEETLVFSDDDFEDSEFEKDELNEENEFLIANISNANLDDFFIPVNDILGSNCILSLQTLFKGIRKIVGLFNSSTQLMDELLNKQDGKPLRPIQDVITRWNSLFAMLERFLVLFLEIKEVINSRPQKYALSKDLINSYKKNEITLLGAVVEILRPFFKVTEILSGQKYTTSSLIIHSVFYLKKKLNVKLKCNISTKLQKILLVCLDFYIEKYQILENSFLCCAVFMNPEYRDLVHCEHQYKKDRIKEKAVEFIKNFSFLNKSSSLSQSENSRIQKSNSNESVDSFFGEPSSSTMEPLNERRNEDIKLQIEIELVKFSNLIIEPNTKCSSFWQIQTANFPLLHQVARVVLTATATAVPSERLFSQGSNQVWARRNRISAGSVEQLMFLLSNLEN
jgi:hypothetical protein